MCFFHNSTQEEMPDGEQLSPGNFNEFLEEMGLPGFCHVLMCLVCILVAVAVNCFLAFDGMQGLW